MLEWVRQLLADAHGVPDEARFGFVACLLAYIGFEAYWLMTGHVWEPTNYGYGVVTIVTGYGVALRARGAN